ncbi:hypothetical protein D3C87_1798560 [compost metagenome]
MNEVATGDVAEKRAKGCGGRRWRKRFPLPLGSRKSSGKEAYRGAFHVPFAAGDLAGEAQAGAAFQRQ